MKIFLIGLPGAGKSTLGKQLSDYLAVPFIDLDAAIEAEEGKSITSIFSEKGEQYFRQQESIILKKWCDSPSYFVMATGGGAPCFHDNMKWMNTSGKTIFLDLSLSEIFNHLKKGDSARPLLANLTDEQLEQKIKSLRNDRIEFYNQAHLTITGAIEPAELVKKIKE